MKFAKNHKSRV